jgi:two-component system, response regulator YesN
MKTEQYGQSNRQQLFGEDVFSIKKDYVDYAIAFVNTNYCFDISLQNIADLALLCPTYMSEQFKKRTGQNFSKYITNLRIKKAKELLGAQEFRVYEISEILGYTDCNYFIKVFKRITKKTPNQYRMGCSQMN